MRRLQLSKTFYDAFQIDMHEDVPHTLQVLTGNRSCTVIVIVYMDCGNKSKKSRELVEIMPADDWKGFKKSGTEETYLSEERAVHRFSKEQGKKGHSGLRAEEKDG